ncbi:MAG: VOC family protein [Rhodospirillaceae bacterium]|jgi:lactoylglutathione lyase|nr:VOC family protein [Rhodospirillaceae bacterium]
MFKRIDHVALDVADIDRSITFYETLFGCKHYYDQLTGGGLRIAYLRSGDTVLELVNRDAGGMNGFHFCFESDDFDGDVARLTEAGIEAMTPPHDTDAREPREKGWRRVVFKGPDGEAIEFRG